MMGTIYVHSFETDIGTIRTAADSGSLFLLVLPDQPVADFEFLIRKLHSEGTMREGGQVNLQTERQVRRYLSGELTEFTVPLDLIGTDFQKRALNEVAAIPYGRIRTYGQIAKSLGNPNASRAVGSANARNPLPLIIPCHRVVATTGLGGYGGGLPLKEKLLLMERTRS